MWNRQNFSKILCITLLLQLVTGRTVLHREINTDSNGEQHTKVWTTHEPDEDFSHAGGDGEDGFQTFTRNGITLRIKPQVTTIRIGGNNATPDQLLEQAKHAKEFEILAVRRLLRTRHPVKRTSFENGRKQTSTYTLGPDGSIVCKKVEDIDMGDVERRFEEILKQHQAQRTPNKLSDWEWAENDKPKVNKSANPSSHTRAQQIPQVTKNYQPAPWQTPLFQKRFDSTATDIFGDGDPSLRQTPQLPKSWNTDEFDKDDPFNPPELPKFVGFGTEFDPFDDSSPPAKKTNTLHTSYARGPNAWKGNTGGVSANDGPTDTTTIRTQAIPSLEDFITSQYNPRRDYAPQSPATTVSTTVTPNSVKTLTLDGLQPVAVVNINKPADEQTLHPLGSATVNQKPIKTLKIDNIPQSTTEDDQGGELIKVRTITKTVHGNQVPSVSDLDPNMLDILQHAGIRPEEITKTDGQTITRRRIEPDGRIVTTTYRVSPSHNFNNFERPTPIQPFYFGPNPNSPFAARTPYHGPAAFDVSPPANHQSASHFGIDFQPFPTGLLDETTTATTPQPVVGVRELLEGEHEDEKETATLNPLHIHPVLPEEPEETATNATPIQPLGSRALNRPIAQFLAKIGISMDDFGADNGKFVKTLIDDDGRILTATFVLTAAGSSMNEY